MPIKILFLHANIPNYPIDGLFHGLRSLLGADVVDVPRYDVMYQDATPAFLQEKTGNEGKIFYGKLPDLPGLSAMRTLWQAELHKYDYILVADIEHLADTFARIYYALKATGRVDRLAIVDGYDSAAVFPFFDMRRKLRHHRWYFGLPVHRVKYFKREFVSYSQLINLPFRLPGLEWLIRRRYGRLRTFGMSIPAEYIEEVAPHEKTQRFPGYLVDHELAETMRQADAFNPVGQKKMRFSDEAAYLADIRRTRFGVTTKRAGWDCLRHYEYAAKGAVLCFRDLDHKHPQGAPHGLGDHNCITYASAAELLAKIDQLTPEAYQRYQEAGYAWVKNQTTVAVAQGLLAAITKE